MLRIGGITLIKVSIIIPIYNMEQYLEPCLDSVLGQTLEEIEVVCVNDGSTDKSLKILEKYKKKSGKVCIVSQENQGVGNARNNGIKKASGKYIAFMDPDDYYLDSGVLEDLYQAAEEQKVLICGGSLAQEHKNGALIRKEYQGSYTNFTFTEAKRMSYKDYQYDYGFYRFIFNREFLLDNQIFFPPYIRFQDPPFFVKAMIKAGDFYALPRITYCYRCGHQKLDWNEERICALLQGFRDNLVMSKEAELKELHRLTVDRMFREYRKRIVCGLEQKSEAVLELLVDADSKIEKAWLEEDSEYRKGIAPLVYEWEEKNVKRAVERERVKTREANVEFENVRNSTTFKVGKIIMKLPVTIKDLWKKGFKQEDKKC